MREDLEELLNKKSIDEKEKELVFKFFLFLSKPQRERMFIIFRSYPEKIDLFVKILKTKLEIAGNSGSGLSEELLSLEKEQIKDLIA
ncbi:hypothetical protein A3C91_02515 [Candidatus Azambacteria bacterium RIFCSPHIGHO2_02_FULL_52_12]|uniref:Uncharacterized protein n=1 Tax=Candidatus Azambacteria bacterium RIFCSPLOWO2_01_FULL_46_25 TaxID=1797298 RepID=A0A1F5BVQ7_9BACT|nr:MAG: hypothetical protein A3C91_02515 [Candidatus Azambacteria bacterium RIFCSPHIGHO2_02_FULL_52_12]OGD34692.1 MAG: hypothetical protein A2988_04310 [Candidatus Azambacteria bacterium RIFCSPLOWO2_01_FULL_46_25]OGD37462.1 MAG: hypothetical protein A2850_02740 [Candidatus Azambacteria bacterium RIFCSPHIGHO2_01_FULL_51_74]